MNAIEPRAEVEELLAGGYDAQSWLMQAIAVLDAISMGELFGALPSGEDDRLRHQAGASLLEMLERQLKVQLILCRNGMIPPSDDED